MCEDVRGSTLLLRKNKKAVPHRDGAKASRYHPYSGISRHSTSVTGTAGRNYPDATGSYGRAFISPAPKGKAEHTGCGAFYSLESPLFAHFAVCADFINAFILKL